MLSLRRPLQSGLVCAALSLVGCTHLADAVRGTLSPVWGSSTPDLTKVKLNPALRYVRVDLDGHGGLMVWADDEPGPFGKTSVWYSADGSVLRLTQGRIVGFASRDRQWSLSVEDAASVPNTTNQQTTRFLERHDEQPGYRYGLRQWRVHMPLTQAPKGQHWLGSNHELTWFQEHDTSAQINQAKALALDDPRQPAWFAVASVGGTRQVVYGARCLAPDWCLHWQTWPTPP